MTNKAGTNTKLRPKSKTSVFVLSEYQEQGILVKWLRDNNILHASVPNSREMSSFNRKVAMKTEAKLKKAGKRKGFPDLIILEPRGRFHGLFIELKKENGTPSDVSKDQLYWLKILREKGYHTRVGYGSDHAIEIIKRYMRGLE